MIRRKEALKKILGLILCLSLALCMSVACTDAANDKRDSSNGSSDAFPEIRYQPSEDSANRPYERIGEYVYFGAYPQSVVTDRTLKSALYAAAGDNEHWASNDNGWKGRHTTVYYDGAYYLGTFLVSHTPEYLSKNTHDDVQSENGYGIGTVYWFRYEPIKWRILSESNGEALLLSEKILDSREFYSLRSIGVRTRNGGTGYANNYAISDMRKWLNGTFYDTAFNEVEKACILITTVDNGARSTYPDNYAAVPNECVNEYACDNTEDRVFLLSRQEVTRDAYGINGDAARTKDTTDFAQNRGAAIRFSYASIIRSGKYVNWPVSGTGSWWLRSPLSSDYSSMQCVFSEGVFGRDYVDCTAKGVVPAIRIRL